MNKRKITNESNHAPSKRSREDDSDDDIDLSQNPDFLPDCHDKEAEAGIIDSIYLKNFMCHTRLEFNFNANVNFITGRNGSGKSAVMTALVIGLGGKASVTDRGSSVKGLIKSGCSSGEVQIKLKNMGPDAYKPEKYGSFIKVERRMRCDGTSTYSIRNEKGQIVSQKKEELTHIVDQFNIQVDNPVSILNQDTSRNFLHSKSPLDKYKFFLKATQLENMKRDFMFANEQKNVAIEIIENKSSGLPALEKEVLEWERKFKAMDAIKESRKKVQNLKNELAWAFVNLAREKMQKAKAEVDSENSVTPKYESKTNEWQKKAKKFEEDKKEVENKLRQLGDEVKELEPQHNDLKKKKVPTATLR